MVVKISLAARFSEGWTLLDIIPARFTVAFFFYVPLSALSYAAMCISSHDFWLELKIFGSSTDLLIAVSLQKMFSV